MSWGNLTEEKVALYLWDILEALHYLHTCRIAHLDLKVRAWYPSISTFIVVKCLLLTPQIHKLQLNIDEENSGHFICEIPDVL